MAKIGYLYLQRGQWAGQRIVAETWIDRVFSAPVDMRLGSTPQFRYANGWWAIPEKRAYMAVGFMRQLIIVLPDVDVVAVVTGKRNYPLLPLIEQLLGAVAGKAALPADADGNARLAERVRAAAIEKPMPVGPASPLGGERSPARSGASTATRPGCARCSSISGSPAPRYRAEFEGGAAGMPRSLEGPIGLDGVSRSQQAATGQVFAVKGRWLNDDTFQVVSHP